MKMLAELQECLGLVRALRKDIGDTDAKTDEDDENLNLMYSRLREIEDKLAAVVRSNEAH